MMNRKVVLSLLALFVFGSGCSHTEIQRQPDSLKVYRAHDPRLKSGDLTIWKLQELAQARKFEILEKYFNNGVSLDSLPVGYAAGAAGRVLSANETDVGLQVLDIMTGTNWRGKLFFQSENPRQSHGLNRIKRLIGVETAPIVPMAAFTTELIDRHALVPQATSRLVTLNYASPKTQNYFQEVVLTQIQVYDLMVAVPGKYGPLYIGKTWLGSYGEDGSFMARNPNKLIAWFFLDFNQEAVDDQLRNHWDQSSEVPIRYKN